MKFLIAATDKHTGLTVYGRHAPGAFGAVYGRHAPGAFGAIHFRAGMAINRVPGQRDEDVFYRARQGSPLEGDKAISALERVATGTIGTSSVWLTNPRVIPVPNCVADPDKHDFQQDPSCTLVDVCAKCGEERA